MATLCDFVRKQVKANPYIRMSDVLGLGFKAEHFPEQCPHSALDAAAGGIELHTQA
jgi:hypothetical protein